MIAVLVGVLLLHERLASTGLAGMAAILVAVILLTTSQMRTKGKQHSVEELEQMPPE